MQCTGEGFIKSCPEFVACMSNPVCAWAQGTGLILGELGAGGDTCWERQLLGRGCRMSWRWAATHLGLTCTPGVCSSSLSATCTPSLGFPWCVLTLGGALWDAHPWMSKQTDPTLDWHLRELSCAAVWFFKQKWQQDEILSWYWDFGSYLGHRTEKEEKLNSGTAGWIGTASPAAPG